MLIAEPTPNLTGVLLIGDTEDFEDLYEAIHKILAEENIPKEYFNVRIRLLSLCYDLRHARMGNRNAFFKSHGLTVEQMAYLSLVGPNQNLYLSFETLWPELLFEVFALEDFIQIYTKKNKPHNWDATIITVRKFQSIIGKLLEELLTPRQFSTIKKAMSSRSLHFKDFFTQYVDILNNDWIKMDKQLRMKYLSIFAKRLTQPNTEYESVKKDILQAAKEHNCHPSEIEFSVEYPEQIEW